jgi:ribosome-associated translation inhibitor RaiA
LSKKFEKFFGKGSLLDFELIVDKIHEDAGGKTLYEVIGTLDTTLGKFRTTEEGWDILNIIDEVEKELTRLITEKKEMKKWKRRLPANP